MVGFALFGAGRIGAMHAQNIVRHPRAALRCVYDVNTQAAEAVTAGTRATVAPSVERALADPTVDAVLIASSTDTHVDLISAAAKAGKAVLCEKPIDLDIARVEQCKREIAGTGVPVQIGFNRRYDPSHRALAHAVRQGAIGPVQLLVISSRDPSIAPMGYMKTSGGIFRDMTIHDFDLARFVLGEEITEVFATGSVLIAPELAGIGDLDTAMVVMKTESGGLVHINNSRVACYGYDQRVEAFGPGGMLVSGNRRATTVERWSKDGTGGMDPLLEFFIERYAEAYVAELDDFIDAVEKRRAPEVDFEAGRRALLLADAAWESVRAGQSVRVGY